MKKNVFSTIFALVAAALFVAPPVLRADDDLEIFDFEKEISLSLETPTIEFFYGFDRPSIAKEEFSSDFSKLNSLEIRLGTASIDEYLKCENLLDYDFSYFSISNFNERLGSEEAKPGEIKTEIWKFGFGDQDGGGYKLGESASVILYTGNSWQWTKTDFKDSSLNEKDNRKMNYFGDSFRFGGSVESGLKIRLLNSVSLNASYRRNAVYQRHLFWYWAASGIIQAAGEGLLDMFVDKIQESSPYIAPVVRFALISAYNYGFYELKKKNMNWPINTEAPLMIDGFKVGIGFCF